MSSLENILTSSTGFKLPNGANRSPDASWVRRGRWDALTQEEQGRICSPLSRLVVELRSQTDSLKSLREKMQEIYGQRCPTWMVD
jgi:Uma2 family endonuclease